MNCTKEPELERTLKGHRDAISSVSFSPAENSSVLLNRHARDSNRRRSSQLASASLDGTVMLWNFFSPDDESNENETTRTTSRSRNTDQVRVYRWARRFHNSNFHPSSIVAFDAVLRYTLEPIFMEQVVRTYRPCPPRVLFSVREFTGIFVER